MLLLLVLAVLACLLMFAGALFVSWLVSRRGGRPGIRGLGMSAAVIAGAAIGIPVLALAWGAANGDPETLRLDARDGLPVDELPGDEPGASGFAGYDFERIELRLPGGCELRAEVVGVVAQVDGRQVESLSARMPSATSAVGSLAIAGLRFAFEPARSGVSRLAQRRRAAARGAPRP